MVTIAPGLYPFQGKKIDRRGFKQHYLDEGAGPPVLMVHGNPTWSFYFRGLTLALRDRFRCLVPDHLGCGLSDKPGLDAYPYDLKSRIDDLEALVDAANLGGAMDFILHDWGGMIGMGLATRRPELVRRLVLLNTAAFGLPPGKKLPWTLKAGRDSGIGRRLILQHNAFCRAAARWCAVRKPLSKEVREAYLAPYDTPANRIATLRFVQDIPLRPGDPSFAVVDSIQKRLSLFARTPTLILWGARDFVFDDAFLAEWRRRLPQAEVHRFADAGHYVLEDRGEECERLTREFLLRPT
ncbi:MAG TPA: alpha/beta fold hydrolase [Planctomycetia bacterium]|nr:alpha/beta fold hydrolase [Planctomycetia bacterium]